MSVSIKNIKIFSGVASIAGLMALALVVTPVTAESSTVYVIPKNLDWAERVTLGGDVNFVADSTSPFPAVALQLTTDATSEAKAGYVSNGSFSNLSTISELAYSTKRVAGTGTDTATYQLEVYLNGLNDPKGPTILTYQPTQVTTGVWQTWDVDAGRFWSSRLVPPLVVAGSPTSSDTYSLAELRANYPYAVVTTFGVNLGSNTPSYNVHVDGVNYKGVTYDFELAAPKPVSPTTAAECKNGGWKNFQTPYKNEKQCLADVPKTSTAKR